MAAAMPHQLLFAKAASADRIRHFERVDSLHLLPGGPR